MPFCLGDATRVTIQTPRVSVARCQRPMIDETLPAHRAAPLVPSAPRSGRLLCRDQAGGTKAAAVALPQNGVMLVVIAFDEQPGSTGGLHDARP